MVLTHQDTLFYFLASQGRKDVVVKLVGVEREWEGVKTGGGGVGKERVSGSENGGGERVGGE